MAKLALLMLLYIVQASMLSLACLDLPQKRTRIFASTVLHQVRLIPLGWEKITQASHAELP
jgi:hypothetical protein